MEPTQRATRARGRRRPVTPLVARMEPTSQAPPRNLEQDFVIDGRHLRVLAAELKAVRQLGRGAFGCVELMQHEPTGTMMAVKRVPYTGDSREQKQLLMDLDVNRKTGDFPYTVKFFGALFQGGDVWLCMEVMDTSLDKFYKMVYDNGHKIPEEVLGKIAVAVLQALHFLKKELKVMHRDVKPSNILINRNGDVKICDYGISGKLVNSLASTAGVGCRPYMGPERIATTTMNKPYDIRSDVWSFGISMMELAMGRFPYESWKNVFQQIKQVVESDAPRLPADQGFSEDFQNIISICLQKNCDHRPKYDQLMQHPFYTKYLTTEVDVSSFVVSILDQYDASAEHEK